MKKSKRQKTYKKGNNIRAAGQVLKNFDLSFDLLLFDGLEDFDDALVVVGDVDGLEYLGILASTQLSNKLPQKFIVGKSCSAYLIIVLISPFDNMTLVVPVLPRPVGVRFRVIPSPGRRDHSKKHHHDLSLKKWQS